MAGDGTVRGAFDLDTGSAVRGVADYRSEAEKADAVTRQLGGSIDDAFGRRRVEKIDRVAKSTRDYARTTEETQRRVSSSWRQMRHDVEGDAASILLAIDAVDGAMDRLGAKRVSPKVDVNGIAKALADVELLERRLDALDRRRVNPRIALGGGGGGAAGGVARAAAGDAAGGGGGVLSMGRVGGTLAATGAAALPTVQALAGASVALAGSLTGAALGAGVTGLAGGGALAAGIGSVMAVAKPAVGTLKEAVKAQDAYTKAVQQYGRRSKEAATAQQALDRVMRNQPGLRYATQQLRGFQREWSTLTAPGRAQFFGGIGDVTQIARRVAPNMAANGNLATGAVRGQAVHAARFLAGNEMQDSASFFTRSFARELPTAERSLENVALTVTRIARAATPFFHEANVWVRDQTAGWRSATSNIAHVRDEMRPLVDEAKDWARLTGATFDIVRDLFTLGRPAGDSMVVDLTTTLDRWDSWIQHNPQRVQSFFTDTVSSTEKIAGALAGAVHWLNEMASALRPLLDRFTQLVTVASNFGLIGTPGSAAALVGAYRGARGLTGGGAAGVGAAPLLIGGRGGGGSGTGAGSVNPWAGAAGPAAASVWTNWRTNSALRNQAASGIGAGGSLGAQSLLAARASQGLTLRGAASSAVRGSTYGLARGFGRGRGASVLAQLGAGTATARMGGAAILGGAARAYAPIALALGGLDFASAKGSFTDRTQSAASSMTFGLISMPTTRADARQQGVQQAAAAAQALGPASTRGQVAAHVRELQRQRQAALSQSHVSSGGGVFGGRGFLGAFDPGRGGDKGPTQTEATRNAARAVALQGQINSLMRTEVQLRRQRNSELDSSSVQRARQYGAGLGGAYGAYRRGGQSRDDAMGNTVDQVKDRLKKTRDAGVETLGEAGLAWARALRNKTPAMKKEIDDLNLAIQDRFKRMGQVVSIVNGNILTGSKSEWGGIRDAMTSATEQASEQVTKDFTAIQQQAVGSLVAMGFSRSQATTTIRNVEQGAAMPGARQAQGGPSAAGDMAAGARGSAMAQAYSKKATGGIIPGRGLMDTVPFGAGAMAAPGEAWIANRHTLADMSRATVEKYGLTAQQMIRGETRRHGYATGGVTARGGMGGDAAIAAARTSRLSGVQAGVANVVSALLGANPGLTVTSTTGGVHAKNSLHYRGMAVDVGGSSSAMMAGASWLGQHYGKSLAEGIHNPNLSIKNGQRVDPSLWGSAVWADHANHIHVGVTGGGGARGIGGAAVAGMMGAGRVSLHGVGQKQPGVPGVLRGRAGDIYAAALTKRLNAKLATMGGGGALAGFSGGGDSTANMSLGRRMMLASGWGPDQWSSLRQLWQGESGWSSSARNASSGAFGIPQALPASKMGPAAVAGDAAAQIRWGLGYIRDRYGSPTQALGAWQSRSPHWYARGGSIAAMAGGMNWGGAFASGGSAVTNGPTMFVAGEGQRRRERITVTSAEGGKSTQTSAGGRIHIDVGGVQVTIQGNASKQDAEAIAEKVGEIVVRRIIKAIDQPTDGVVN